MIMINEQWYEVRDLADVVKLIREEFNYDLADKIEELFHSERLDYEKDERIEILEDEKEELIGEIRDLEYQIRTLESEGEW